MTKRVALITGGAKGIGRAIALKLAREGWSIAFCWRTSERAASETQSAVKTSGSACLSVRCDVSDARACENLVRDVNSEFGRIDALIHCAGPYAHVPLMEQTLDEWRAMFDNNLHPVFHLSRLVAPIMIEQKWGRILTFSVSNADRLAA